MKVYVNYGVLNKNGEDYLKYSESLEEIINSLKTRKENISNNWKSNSSVVFDKNMNDFIDDLQVDANRMKRHANIILGIEDKFKEKDLEYKKHFNPEVIEEDIYGK